MMKLTTVLAVLAYAAGVSSLDSAGWRSQSIYQVVTDRFARTDGSTTEACNTGDQVYCGGTWQGLISKLDYIKEMGFTAIWISPVVENIEGNSEDGSAYHGYWAKDINQVNTNFGTAADLVELSSAVRDAGLYFMVDVVTNHMGYMGCGDCVDYTTFSPFNSDSYYHPFCLIDYEDDSTLTTCWEGDNIVSLPDLKTEDDNVLSIWKTWIEGLVANYTIDGLRLDSTLQLDKEFFAPFQEAAGGIHILGEVAHGDPAVVCPFQESVSGVLNYPAFYWITQAFQSTSGSISNLVNGLNTMKSECSDTTVMGSFLENHDQPRFPSLTSDISLTKNAIAFTFLQDGIPILYAGQEQHYSGGGTPNQREAVWLSGFPQDSELYTWVATLNAIRNQAIYNDDTYVTYQANPIYSDDTTIALRKGQVISVYTNQGADAGSSTITLPSADTGFTADQALIEVGTCATATADSNGDLAVALEGGLPNIYYAAESLADSGICDQ